MMFIFIILPELWVGFLVRMISQGTKFSLKKLKTLQIDCFLHGIHLLGFPITSLTWHTEMHIILDGLGYALNLMAMQFNFYCIKLALEFDITYFPLASSLEKLFCLSGV